MKKEVNEENRTVYYEINKNSEYGIITPLLLDNEVEDIFINGEDVLVFLSGKGIFRTNISFKDFFDLGKLSYLRSYNMKDLADEDYRINIITPPFSDKIYITIRKKRNRYINILDLINQNFLTIKQAAYLWEIISNEIYKFNVMIGGVMGSGKTTFLDVLSDFIPQNERIVIIEDVMELRKRENFIRLLGETKEEMNTLIRNAIRMRPNRIIIGEIRGEEAINIFTAMRIGYGFLGTIHAISGRDLIKRLSTYPMNIPKEIIPTLNISIIVELVEKNGILTRRIKEIHELGYMEGEISLFDLSNEENINFSRLIEDYFDKKEFLLRLKNKARFLKELLSRYNEDNNSLNVYEEIQDF